MITCPDLAKAEIDRLRADSIEPTLDDIAALIHWAKRVERPRAGLSPLLERAPYRVGNCKLYPLTVQAEEWIELVSEWFPASLSASLVAYAMAHGREEGAFDELTLRHKALRAVKAWRRKCTASQAEIAEAVETLIGDPPPLKTEGVGSESESLDSLTDLMAELLAGTGLPPSYWYTHTSDEMLGALRALHRRYAVSSGMGYDPPDEAADALRSLALTAKAIRDREKGEA